MFSTDPRPVVEQSSNNLNHQLQSNVMIERRIEITTPDGVMPTFEFYPEEGGPHPVVFYLMDAPSIRPALRDMASRLASARGIMSCCLISITARAPTESLVPAMKRCIYGESLCSRLPAGNAARCPWHARPCQSDYPCSG